VSGTQCGKLGRYFRTLSFKNAIFHLFIQVPMGEKQFFPLEPE